jgi:hypothetical protein
VALVVDWPADDPPRFLLKKPTGFSGKTGHLKGKCFRVKISLNETVKNATSTFCLKVAADSQI